MFVSNATMDADKPVEPEPTKKKGCKVMKPRYQIEDAKRTAGIMTNNKSLNTNKPAGAWEVLLSESSGSENEDTGLGPRKARIKEKSVCDKRVALKELRPCMKWPLWIISMLCNQA